VSTVEREPVEVWLIDGKPARFVWRGRLYSILAVLGRRTAAPGAGEVWRVRAAPGKNVPPSTYELSHDPAQGRWRLSRIAP
jgi:hypothetical protein